MFRVRDSSQTSQAITRVRVRDAFNVLQEVEAIRVRDTGGMSRIVFQAFSGSSLVATPNFVSGAGYSPGSVVVSTAETTVTSGGGTPPFTHAWTSPDAGWSAVNPTGATTSFRKSVMASDAQGTTYTDTVTDANGDVATVTVGAYVTNNYDPG